MPNMNQFRQVAENVFYRFVDQRYSVADEYGEHAYTSHCVKLLVFPLIKRTKCGAWIGLNYSHYPVQPGEWSTACHKGKRFVNLQANKRFALPTIVEAASSYHARKERQIRIYEARIDGARKCLRAMERFMNTEVPPSLRYIQMDPVEFKV